MNNIKERLEKFDVKSDEAIFLGYSSSSKAFRVFNKRTLVVEESIHVIFDETNDLPSRKSEEWRYWWCRSSYRRDEGAHPKRLNIQNEEEHDNKQEDEGEE